MRLARVFPTKTSMTPIDENAYFDFPDLLTPLYDEVRISCTFTWDIEKSYKLREAWESQCNGNSFVGGPAFGEKPADFTPCLYLKQGITITSRGCPNKCEHCLVPIFEGGIKELPIAQGNIVQDNNILACSDQHIQKVFDMLKTQRAIEFKGGLELRRITPKIAEKVRSLRIKTLWLACDNHSSIIPFQKAIKILQKAGFNQNHIYSYVLIGKDREEEETRLRCVYNLGAMPFAQLYQPPTPDKIEYSKDWKNFCRTWSRPAIYKKIMSKESTKC